jgi:hypothetical protein
MMDICDVKKMLEILTAVLALGAAGLWFAAARAGWFPFLGTPMDLVERYLKWQAAFNAFAAMCAGLAAVMQLVVSAYMPVCRAFS